MAGSADEAAAFDRELIDINLRRIPWLLVLGMALAAWAIVSIWADPAFGSLRWLLVMDLASAAGLLALNHRVRRQPPPLRGVYLWMTVVLSLAFMDGYSLLLSPAFGHTPIYILGVVMAGTVFLLRPGLFLPILILNHLAYWALLRFSAPPDAQLVPVLIQDTTGVAVAGLVSVLLHRARREEFSRRQALAAANRTLEKRNRQLNEVMAITAHDLRSPLLGVRDLLTLARRAPEAAQDMLAEAARSCGELLDLVSRLLDAHAAEARAQAGLALERADVRGLLAAAVERARGRARMRQVGLVVEVPDHPVLLPVDGPGLGQVVDNLLSNAVKFSPEGAVVRIRLWRAGEHWCCDVEDAGPGIAAQDRAALFGKFQRGAPPASGETGNGLGLFIAATFMGAMGGTIAHEPGERGGARFRLTFADG